MKKDSLIYVAGHEGFVGSAMVRKLKESGYTNLVLKSNEELDLKNQYQVRKFFEVAKPEYVFLIAEKVGGILANKSYPAEFIYQNMVVQTNIIHSTYQSGVKKLLFPGSSCSYPKLCLQPMKEEYLLSGSLEPTNEAYAVAKIAGMKMCQAYNQQYGTNFIVVIPANLYGINDDFDLQDSHVIPSLIRKFHEAKENNEGNVIIWGTGEPRREFFFVDDYAEACLFLMNEYSSSEIINIGRGEDISIIELANLIKEVIGFEGEIIYDKTKPDGMPRKLLEISKINSLDWKAKTDLKDGITATYAWYRSEKEG